MDRSLTPIQRMAMRPPRLLSGSNSDLRRDGIFTWCLPAWEGVLPDGREYNTCRSAGICAQVCYARAGTYRFSNVLERHERNLAYVLDDLPGWTEQMIAEIGRKRGRVTVCKRGRATVKERGPIVVRIHDAGDFFNDSYTKAWLTVMAACPQARFYSYTKEVTRFRRLIEPNPPANFKWVYSYGGVQDARLDERRDRVCDVFPTVASLRAAKYNDQAPSDLLAVDGPAPVGMTANRIPHFLKVQGDRRFSTWQKATDAQAARRRKPTRVLTATAAFGNRLLDAASTGPAYAVVDPDPWGPVLDELLLAKN